MTSHGTNKRFPIRAAWLLVLGAALIAACGMPGDNSRAPTETSSPTGQTPGGQIPVANGGSYTLSGVLTLRTTSGTRPLANVGVSGFLVRTNDISHGIGTVTTDADGRYQFSNVPSGVVVLYAGAPHAYMPCAAIGTVVSANGVKDIELVDSAATRPTTTADSPTLSGVVYRKTAAGKEPLAGAVIEFEYSPVPALQTTTDAQGRYSLCQLPAGRGGVDVWLNGVNLGGAVVNISGDAVLDFNF